MIPKFMLLGMLKLCSGRAVMAFFFGAICLFFLLIPDEGRKTESTGRRGGVRSENRRLLGVSTAEEVLYVSIIAVDVLTCCFVDGAANFSELVISRS